MVVHAYSSNLWEAEAGELQILGQLGLRGENLTQKEKQNKVPDNSTWYSDLSLILNLLKPDWIFGKETIF